MSRRTGPGGRLRPAPRQHRAAGRVDLSRPAPIGTLPLESPADGDEAGTPEAMASGQADETVETVDAASAGSSGGAWSPDPDAAPVANSGDGLTATPPDRPATGVAPTPADATPPADDGAPPVGSRLRNDVPSQRPERRRTAPTPALAREPRGAEDATAGAPPQAGSVDGVNCTSAQLRRFIKSRAYVPMHELRRRFAIEGGDDDVSWMDVESGRIYVGLPPAAGQLLGDLVRNGEVGYELSVDPATPIVIGVYAMRPITRV